MAERETLKDLILEARKKWRVTNAMIGKAVGVGDQSISDYVRGIRPTPAWASNWENLATVLHVSVERLRKSVENTFSDQADNITSIEPLHAIPEWELHVAAGDWIDSCVNGTIDTDNPAQELSLKQGLFIIKIRGDSMEPRFTDGTSIMFKVFRHGDEDDSIQVARCYYVHRSDGTCTFKMLESIDEDVMILRALNKRKYPKPLLVPVQEVVRMARAIKIVTDIA